MVAYTKPQQRKKAEKRDTLNRKSGKLGDEVTSMLLIYEEGVAHLKKSIERS